MANQVRNILTIAGKELRGYFASPIAWVMLALFAAIFAFFYGVYLDMFLRNSSQPPFGGGPQSVNVNMEMIRGLWSNTTVLVLFLLPMVTMRTYAEEKRTGTFELLLTSPITDVEILLGKFLAVMGLYGAILLITLLDLLILFAFGNPEWRPLLAGYLGLLLLGGAFVALGLFISSMTKNQMVAGTATFIVLLLFWIINWAADTMGPTPASIVNYLSITQHFDDFGKGIIDTKHVIFYLSFITFGLFLTLKSADAERWRG